MSGPQKASVGKGLLLYQHMVNSIIFCKTSRTDLPTWHIDAFFFCLLVGSVMCVAILFGAFNDFAIKSPVGALTGHAGICEVAAEHSRGLVGDFRRFSVDVWCLN